MARVGPNSGGDGGGSPPPKKPAPKPPAKPAAPAAPAAGHGYDLTQLENLWIQAGGNPAVAPVMAAIAIQQSGGDPNALNPVDSNGLPSVGLWQENGQQYMAVRGNALEQARIAVQMYNTRGFEPWQENNPNGGVMQNTVVTAWENAGRPGPGGSTSFAGNTGGGAIPNASGGAANVGTTGGTGPPSAVEDGHGPTNFHGFDLSAIPDTPGPNGGNLLASAEQNILQYANNPALRGNIIARIQQDYGQEAWLLAIPQVEAILIAGAMGGWKSDPNLVQGMIQRTQWWQSHNENQRAWAETQANDPATAREMLAEASAKITDTANQMGVTLTSTQLGTMAMTLASNTATQSGTFISPGHYGFTQEQIDLMVAGAYKYNPTSPQRGQAGELFDQYQKLAGQYMVPMTNDSIGKAVQTDFNKYFTMQGDFVQGAESGFETQLKQSASTLYPTLTSGIQAGLTPYDMTEPYRQTLGTVLEKAPETFNLASPQWSWMLDQRVPGQSQPQMMSLSDVQRQVMNDPKYGYQNTEGARSMAVQLVDSLGKNLGTMSAT